MIEARIIADSIGKDSPRLTTFLTRYPKFIHGEHLRHRTGSFCVSSSRAVPIGRNLEEVRSDELRAGPVWWGREQKGMSSGEELDHYDKDEPFLHWSPYKTAQYQWKLAAELAADRAQALQNIGAHKSIVNRLLEPFLHVNVLWTTCEPGLMNFFGLRHDRAAQPEMRVLAEEVWKVWNENKPTKLHTRMWHLPFVDQGEYDLALNWKASDDPIRVSVARCARLSYTSFETGHRSTIEEDLVLYDRLVGASPIHASPAEHQASPDEQLVNYTDLSSRYGSEPRREWKRPELHGNLPGWIQYRKTLPGESIAPLREGYYRSAHQ